MLCKCFMARMRTRVKWPESSSQKQIFFLLSCTLKTGTSMTAALFKTIVHESPPMKTQVFLCLGGLTHLVCGVKELESQVF